MLTTYDVDVFMVQDTKKTIKEMPVIDNYILARTGFSRKEIEATRIHNSGIRNKKKKQFKSLVAIYVRKDIPFSTADYVLKREGNGASCSIEIDTGGKTYHFCSVYYPEGMSQVDVEQFRKFNNDKDDNKVYVFSGDFNDHAYLWSNLEKDRNSRTKLSDAIDSSNLVNLNDGNATRFPDNATRQRPSAIDLTFASSCIGDSHWEVITHALGGTSDHCPIFGEINTNGGEAPSEFIPSYIYDKGDWLTFGTKLADENSNSPGENTTWDQLSVDDHFNAFHSNIFRVTDEHKIIPKTKFNPLYFGISWWNEQCSEAKYNKQVASHNYTVLVNNDNLAVLNEMTNVYNKTIAEAKLRDWENTLINQVLDYRDSGVLWRKIKKLRRGRPAGKTKLKDSDPTRCNKKTQTDFDKASILAESLSGVSQSANIKDDKEKEKRQMFERNYEDPISDNTLEFNQPITFDELEEAIKNIKNKKKATGSDPLNYLMISYLPKNQKMTLLDLYNKCLMKGEVPAKWKEAQVITLLKPGKPACDPSSYRPISLTPHAGKLFEQIIKRRLELHLEKHNIIPEVQSGFRQSRCTTDNLVYLTECMKRALRKKYQGMYCTFFDIEKAFDKVWHCKLLSQLAKIGINGNLYNVIKNFLSNRKMQVRYGNSVSALHDIDMGVPQGAVLSPTLFTIMLHDIVQEVELHGNKLMLYADDIALISDVGAMHRGGIAGGDPVNKALLEGHQKAIDSLNDYIKNLGFNFSEKKTQFMCVSHYAIPKRESLIKINGHTIYHSNTIKYLGLTFQSKLNWGNHFSEIVKKSHRINNLLKILSAKHWAKGSKFLVDVARSLIRSVVSYGQECFFSAPQHHLYTLDKIEYKALRIVLGLPPNTPTYPSENLYMEVGWLPLDEERRLRCAEYVIRSQIVETNLINPFLSDHLGKHTQDENRSLNSKALFKFIGQSTTLLEETNKLLSDANIALPDIEKIVCPKRYVHQLTPVVDLNPETKDQGKNKILAHYTLKCKKSDNIAAAGADANTYIDENFKNHFRVYTDGSVNSKTSGLGVVCQPPNGGLDRLPFRRNSGRGKCTMSVELEAILCALQIINTQKYVRNVVLTDSLSSIQALKSKPKNNFFLREEISEVIHKCYARGKQIELCHIPSHANIPGNEVADKQANFGAKLTNEPVFPKLSRRECYKLIRDAAKTDPDFFHTLSNSKYNRKGNFLRGANPISITIYRRIRFNNPTFKFFEKINGVNQTCPHCQATFETSHLTINPCPPLAEEFKDLIADLEKANKTAIEVIEEGSISDGIYISDIIQNSSVGYLF